MRQNLDEFEYIKSRSFDHIKAEKYQLVLMGLEGHYILNSKSALLSLKISQLQSNTLQNKILYSPCEII